jgi:uncharacterized repeat protein (TIGR03803 family)
MTFGNNLSCAIRTAAIVVALVLFASSVSAGEWKEKVLYSFQGGRDGSVPAGGVVFDKQGNLYGATSDGGAANDGTVFELIAPAKPGGAWTESVLHIFRGYNSGADGASPEGGLVIDKAGNLYGTTGYGGNGPCTLLGSPTGCGTVYEISPPTAESATWTETILYNFQGGKDGQFPWGNLVFDKEGNLYGATYFGGGYGSCDAPYYQHCGTIFQLSSPKAKGGKWKEKVLYSFKNGKDGANPNGGLTLDEAGTLYGSTGWGGFTGNDCAGGNGFVGCGTTFKLIPPTRKMGSWQEEVLYSFRGHPNDGSGPNGGIVLGPSGAMYGTTVGGGHDLGDGTIFKVVVGRQWKEHLLYTFIDGADPHGDTPEAGVVFDSKGDLYGVASGGSTYGDGTVFRLRQTGNSWAISTLHTFKGTPDGAYPASKLIFDKAGNLYGTTQQGGYIGQNCGHQGCGTVFAISP